MDDIPATTSRSKRSDVIAADIKRWIAERRRLPGDRLPQERELIELFGSSRGTVREALKSLEVQGLIEVTPGPGGGPRVASVSTERASQLLRNYFYFCDLTGSEVYELRRVLEPEMVLSVAGRLSTKDFAELEATVAVCREGLAVGPDADRQSDAEVEFHRILARRCPNRLLQFNCTFLTELLTDCCRPKELRQGKKIDFARHNMEAHEQILLCLKRGDGEGARVAMTAHMQNASDYVSQIEFESRSLITRS